MQTRILFLPTLISSYLILSSVAIQAGFAAPGATLKNEANRASLSIYNKMPLSFEPNQGQAEPRVKFLSRTASGTVMLTSDSAVLRLQGAKDARAALVRIQL